MIKLESTFKRTHIYTHRKFRTKKHPSLGSRAPFQNITNTKYCAFSISHSFFLLFGSEQQQQ